MKKLFAMMVAFALVFGLGFQIQPTYAKSSKVTRAKKTYQKYQKQAKKLGSLKKAQKDLTKKKKAYNLANKTYKNALASYNSRVAKAKQSYNNALSIYDAAGYDFIMSKASANYYEDAKDAMKNNSALSSYVNGLDGSMKRVLSTSNLKNDINLMKELNQFRATDNNFTDLQALGVDYNMMIYAGIAGIVSNTTHNHTYFMESMDSEDSFDSYAENLAWGYSDPLVGWYTEEKAVYDANGDGETGHYLNCVGDYEYVGLILDPKTNTGSADFNYSSDTGTQVTVDEFASALNQYVAPYEGNVKTAKAKYDQEVAKKAAVTSAKKKVTAAKKAYDKANALVKKIKKVNASLKKAKKAYQKALKATRKRK